MEALSVRIGLELAESLTMLTAPERVDLKWPNDLLARGRKLGGILVEARWSGSEPAWVVVGVGLNVSNALPDDLAATAIRLADLGCSAEPASVERLVIDAIGRAAASGGSLTAAELDRFARHDWLRGRMIADPVPGVAQGIGPDGRLLVAGSDGEIRAIADPVSIAGLAPATGGA
jgi:BirA family biotin operon repressor/biotin-[acetyl-CoA-carboxylase] ligase